MIYQHHFNRLGVLFISSRKVILVLQMSSLVFNTAIIGAATTNDRKLNTILEFWWKRRSVSNL